MEIDDNWLTLLHVFVTDNLYHLLRPFVKTHHLGFVHTGGVLYVLAGDEADIRTARIPDVAFLRKQRFPSNHADLLRPFYGAPDFALEVVSAGQTTVDVLDKVTDFLRSGTEEVWVAYPARHELHRYRRGEEAPEYYNENQTFQAETLFPGLTIKIGDLFIVEQA